MELTLFDKNGAEICLGDIVSRYKRFYSKVMCVDGMYGLYNSYDGFEPFEYIFDYMEVIKKERKDLL